MTRHQFQKDFVSVVPEEKGRNRRRWGRLGLDVLILVVVVAALVWTERALASTSICTWDIDRYVCAGSKSNVMVGTPVRDIIHGDGHANTLRGKKGNDKLLGHSGPDTLEGGNGGDYLIGGAGEDILTSGNGDDTINARDPGPGKERTDWVFCGSGFDTVLTVKGGVDYIDTDCERVIT